MGLTVLNLIIVGIGACLVSVIKAEGENAANKHTVRYGFVGFWKSVRILLYFNLSRSMLIRKVFMMIPPALAFRAQILVDPCY